MVVEEDEDLHRARARVGQTLRGKWRLDALLGVGGMASVYAASHRNGNRVAVEWLHPELAIDRKMRERFVLEGYIANRVDHDGVVRVIDDDVADDVGLVLFMDLLDGETVDARWRRSGHSLPAKAATPEAAPTKPSAVPRKTAPAARPRHAPTSDWHDRCE